MRYYGSEGMFSVEIYLKKRLNEARDDRKKNSKTNNGKIKTLILLIS